MIGSFGQFDDAEVRAEVAARRGHLLHEQLPDLLRELLELLQPEVLQVCG